MWIQSHTKRCDLCSDDGKEKTYDITIGPFTELLVTDRMKVRKGDFIAVMCFANSTLLHSSKKKKSSKSS